MTVVFLTRLFYPHIGGVEKHVLELSRILKQYRHTVVVITQQHDKKIKLKETIKGIKVYRIPFSQENMYKKYFIWLWLWKNSSLLRTADIIHCHDVFVWYFPFRLLFPLKPVFTTFHGYENYPIPQKAKIIRKISEILSYGTICIGDFMREWYGTKPTIVSYGGVESKKFKGKSLKLKVRNKESAVFIGRLDSQTSIKEYVKAYQKIKRSFPKFRFTVIGDGPDKNILSRDIDAIGLKKNPYTYLGRHRFTFVSRYLSILEAMAAKRLVFAIYDNLLKKDYLTMTPFSKNIIIAGSSDEVYKKVLYFLKHPLEEKKYVENAYRWVRNQTWDRVADTYTLLWKKYLPE